MEQKELSPKEQRALEKVKRANAELAKVRREERKQLRKTYSLFLVDVSV